MSGRGFYEYWSPPMDASLVEQLIRAQEHRKALLEPSADS